MAEMADFLNNGVEDDNPFFDLDADPQTDDGGEDQQPSAGQVAQWQQTHTQVEQLRQNPQAMRQFVLQQAQALGLQIAEPQTQQTKQTQQAVEPSADYVESIRAGLAPELQFLAPQLAKATWSAVQASVTPLREQQQRHTQQQQAQAYNDMASALTTEAPGWEKYENEMLGILGFLRDALTGHGPMQHSKYGTALKLLYRLAAGEGQATAQASRRMGDAARNATRTSQGTGRGQGPDLETMLSKANSPQQKWQLAMQHALREHGVS